VVRCDPSSPSYIVRFMVDEAHEKSRAVWDEMAPGWERNREFMWNTTRHVTEWLVENVHAGKGDAILDLAGGPGDNGFHAAGRVGPLGKVIETDFAPQMVETARRRATELELENIEARVLDAERMDLADDSVDGIICRWGFMLMLDPQSALDECRRVLKNRRHLALSVWSGPEKNPWVTVMGLTMMQLGHQPSGDPFGPGGVFSMSDHDTIRSMLTRAGFTDITIEEMPVNWSYGSFAEAWDFMTQVAGAIATLVKELPLDEIEKLRAAVEENVQTFGTDSGITLPGVTINASAS
jgi:ubiquinone/menaquinone biosynthesis C-methylase UbiE